MIIIHVSDIFIHNFTRMYKFITKNKTISYILLCLLINIASRKIK